MTDRDRLAADLRTIHGGPAPWPGAMTSEQFADRLIALGWTRLDRTDWRPDVLASYEPGVDTQPEPEPMAVEPRAKPLRGTRHGPDCHTLDEERLARVLRRMSGDLADPIDSGDYNGLSTVARFAAAIATAYREDTDAK